MSDNLVNFDPYHKWLGIPESEQPPNHYRLLGIELFEDDADVIQAAADRQMSHVKAFATGRYAAHSQLVLNELSKARVCLLNAKLKPIYDQQLVKEHSKKLKAQAAQRPVQTARPVASAPAQQAQPQVAPQAGFAPVVVADQPSPTRRRIKKKKSGGLMVPAFVVGGLLAAAVIIYSVVTNSQPTPTVAGTDNTQGSDQGQGQTPSTRTTTPGSTQSNNQGSPPSNTTSNRFGSNGFGNTNRFGSGNSSSDIRKPREWDGDRTLASLLDEDGNEDASKSLFGEGGTEDTSSSGSGSNISSNQGIGVSTQVNQPAVQPAAPAKDNPFGSMPKVISLADYAKGKQIGAFAASIDVMTRLNVTLLVPKYLERGNNVFKLKAVEHSDTEKRWLVFEESKFGIDRLMAEDNFGDEVKPVAVVRATSEGIGLGCYSGRLVEAKLGRLKQCMLRFSDGKYTHSMQMRNYVEDPTPVVVSEWSDPHIEHVRMDTIPNCPPAEDLCMHVVLREGFPTMTPDKGSHERLMLEERLSLKFAATDYAGLGTYWEEKGQRLAVHFAVGFRLLGLGDELIPLSSEKISDAETRARDKKGEIEREIDLREQSAVTLRTAYDRVRYGGSTFSGSSASRAYQEMQANQQRIVELQAMKNGSAEDEGVRVPALRKLASQIEGTNAIGFELYLPIGGERVVIYRRAMPSEN